jgi:uncharacterized protein (DUF58 family)
MSQIVAIPAGAGAGGLSPPRAGIGAMVRRFAAAGRGWIARLVAAKWTRRAVRWAGIVRPRGWVTLAAAVACFEAGRRLGWAELILLGVAGAATMLVAGMFAIGRTAYQVSLDLARLRVTVGDDAYGQITVRGAASRALLPSALELPVGQGVAVFATPRLTHGAEHREAFAIPTYRRSVIPIGPVRSARGDALGLVRREVPWTGCYELFVHPKTVSLAGASKGFLRDLEGRPTSDLSSSDVAFHALREYVVGDDRRHIHWKTSARMAKFMVRQFEETRRSHLAIALSTNQADYSDDAELELAISVAASLGLQAKREDKELTVLVPGRTLHSETGAILLDESARIGPDTSARAIDSLARTAAAAVPDASVAALVVGSRATPERLRSAATRFGIDVLVLAVQCEVGTTLVRRSLGGAVVIGLGDLEDLPRGVRML